MARKWVEDLTYKFVEEYASHECLWNRNLDDYKNRDARNSAYKAIVMALNLKDFTIADVRNKIKNLRSTFNQETKKIKSSLERGTGAGNVYKPKLKWFDVMKKLIDNEDAYPENSQNNVETETSSIGDSQTEEECIIVQDQPKNNAEADKSQRDENNFMESHKSRSNKRMKSDSVDKMKDERNDRCPLSLTPSNAGLLEDEFYFFGVNVASQLRSLPLDRALRTQVKIQSLLAEERISHQMETI